MSRVPMAALLGMALMSSSGLDIGMYGMGRSTPKTPKYKFSEADLETLAAFPDTREGIKAKKKFLKTIKAGA